ncbi:MAG: eukaryotic-like serine/threonine-protein kinase [Thermoanaerobaculia bacterium]|jgi:hypothetical protein|nr:eukaryotic-like serine/threonine-protein kinase [Thermoanaerobaculia bacterium]
MSGPDKIMLAALLAVLCCGAAFAANEYVLTTDPSTAGASVSVDDTFVGETDANGKIVLYGIAPGDHMVRLETGGQSYASEVNFDIELNSLPPFKLVDPNPSPPPREVDYVIDVSVADAEVAVDGAAPAATNSAGRATVRLTVGRTHTITISKRGFKTYAEPITPFAAGELKIVLQHQAKTATSQLDWLLIALVVLLAGSLALLLTMLLRHRLRNAPMSVPVRPTAAVAEETGGHFDRYRLISALGRGGVATIYRAHDLIDKTLIALKVLDVRWTSDPDMVRKFLTEGETLRAIAQSDSVAAVVKCFRFGREHDSIVGRPFIALELLEGETLQSRLDAEPVLARLTAIAVAYQIASALVSVHGAGIVHRDLTPDNIFLKKGDLIVEGTRYGVPLVVLIDFGIARQELMSRMTLDGSIAGKPHYMSPEQCRGLTVDARGDLYSLGVILYLMAAGQLPFAGRDPFEVMRAQMSDEPPRLASQVDPRYADLCGRLLQKSPESRPQSTAAVAQELEQILSSVGAFPSMNVVTFPTRRVSL